MNNVLDRLKSFTVHGVYFTGDRDTQSYGHCAFCGGKDKFHVNKESLLWDCKKCGLKGNLSTFLSQVVKRNVEDCTKEFLSRMAIDRKLPLSAFEDAEIGKDGINYTFPVKDERGRVQDIRIWRPGRRLIGTSNCQTGLIGLHLLKDLPTTHPIYLCEGEWDYFAMKWFLKFLKKPAVVLGVPGASVLKKEWTRFFEGRNVYVMYDNDNAGENGELTVKERLSGCAKSLKYLHWSEKLPSGYDVRDLITQEAIEKKRPRKTYRGLMSMMKLETRKKELPNPGVTQVLSQEEEVPQKKSLEEVISCFKKWLFLSSFEAIEVMLATMVSNKLEGDPLWMFLVSPPGGAKTEILSSLSSSPDVYFTSSLTPHSLISGASWNSGSDPSLIPKLNGKVMVIKDFTSIMSKRDTEKEEIFGILRDAYDGKCSKIFGNGVRRNYESRFTILSAVTPAIYELAHSHQALGERFLKYTMGSNLLHVSEQEIVYRAISNLNKENTMRKEISDTVRGFLYHKLNGFSTDSIASIPDGIKVKIVSLAMFCARLRGTVSRDKYRPDMICSKPSAEVGSRIGKQFAKFCVSLAIVRNKKEVTEEEYAVCRKVAIDTLSQRNEDVLRTLILEKSKGKETLRTKELGTLTMYPHSTISRVLADMQMLGIVDRVGRNSIWEWKASNYVLDLINRSGLYVKKEEFERPVFHVKSKKVVKIRKILV